MRDHIDGERGRTSAHKRVAARGRPIAFDEQPRRQRRPQEKLARLIESATAVFGEEGYTRARIQAVCQSAGVSVGTFYDHFENKADLMLHVAEQANESIPLPNAETMAQFEQHVAALVAAPTAGIARAWHEAIRVEPDLLLANERMRGIQMARYTQWVEETRARRRIRTPLDDRSTAQAVMALLKEVVTGTQASTELSRDRTRNLVKAIWFLLYAE